MATTTNKHTLYSLCSEYDKVEVPIIQRDYAQGREGQKDLRNRFVDYLVNALKKKTPIELDFVYGNEREDICKDGKTIQRTFIPIDGQQRLTTLWLLHWFLAVREGRLQEIVAVMSKFTYETRPTTHDFCKCLLKEEYNVCQMSDISEYIKNCNWFDPEWLDDGSVRGMLRMIDSFSKCESLTNGTILLNQLLPSQDTISFYFVPLKQFGLSEELYIRMNARGKILTEFENFKSEFYKILRNHPKIDVVKDKMEYAWVTNLWNYRKKKVYVTDECFMSFLWFMTRMIYFSQAEYRSQAGYEDDFTNFKLLKSIYSDDENVDFLMFALDSIPFIASFSDFNILWLKEDKLTLSDILSMSIKGEKMHIDQFVVLFAAFVFLKQHPFDYEHADDSKKQTYIIN